MSEFIFKPISLGPLETFVAERPEDILESKKLRYRIFGEELGAQLVNPEIDPFSDPFDSFCDHLLVRDTQTGCIVGTYRLARRQAAQKFGSFYTQSEYDISPLLQQDGEILELSRSCVEKPYRTLPTMNLLWRGLAEYALGLNITFFFGCASFHGTDPRAFEHALSYLIHKHLAPPECRPRVLPRDALDMRILKPEEVDVRQAFRQMPPLIKSYVRVGGFVGEGAFLDSAYNTTDVSIVVNTSLLTQRYAHYYNTRSRQENRFQTS